MLTQLEPVPRSIHWSRTAPLALLYALLLVAAIWKLDNGDLPRDATPVPTFSAAAQAQALMLGFTESLRRAPRDAEPLNRQQSTPEGWPLWTGGAEDRSPDRRAPPPVPTRTPN